MKAILLYAGAVAAIFVLIRMAVVTLVERVKYVFTFMLRRVNVMPVFSGLVNENHSGTYSDS